MADLPAELACPADRCTVTFEVSEVDPDATLSEIRSHLLGAPHYRRHNEVGALLALAQSGDVERCIRCGAPAVRCCSAHNKPLCHLDYRRTHFVEVCVPGCSKCALEGLPVNLSDLPTAVRS